MFFLRDIRISLVSLFVLTGSLYAVVKDVPQDCRVPGTPAQWIAEYCMQKTENDNPEAVAVQQCLIEEIKNPMVKKHKMSACEQKIYRKKQICELFTQDHAQRTKCSEDPNFIPGSVQQPVAD